MNAAVDMVIRVVIIMILDRTTTKTKTENDSQRRWDSPCGLIVIPISKIGAIASHHQPTDDGWLGAT